MSNRYATDKGMKKLFEGFRRILNEGDIFSPADGSINKEQLGQLYVKAANGDKEAAMTLYKAAPMLAKKGENFSTADGTKIEQSAIAKAYGLEVGSDDKAQTPQTPAAKNPIGNPELEKYFDEKTGQYDTEKFFADYKARRKAERAKEDEERNARYAKEDEERKARYRMNEGNMKVLEGEMKRIHMAIMDRLAEIKAEFGISSEEIKVILDDLDSQEEYAAASQEDLQADMDNMPPDMKRRLAYNDY
jgi:hypothetical protein